MVEFSLPARPAPAGASATAVRKRKTHSKSRKGCGNCKLRRVKCDEGTPGCKRCREYGVVCTYNQRAPPEMQLSFGEETSLVMENAPLQVSISTSRTIIGMMNHQLNASMDLRNYPVWKLNNHDLATIGRFLSRTLNTVGTAAVREAYQKEGFRLACTNPFLMHTMLAVTMAHDRHIAEGPFPKASVEELKHSTLGSALFGMKLREQLTSAEKDAIWVTGAFLGVYGVCVFEGTSPQEAWPLQPSDQEELTWLRLSEGKREIYRLADLSRPDSCLKDVYNAHSVDFSRNMTDREAIDQLPIEVVQFLGLDSTAAVVPDQNPYWQSAAIMGRLMEVECNLNSVMLYLSFMSQISADFISLLERKDPRAMLLVAYWEAKISSWPGWWIFRRAWFESQAVCIYLKRWHANIPNLDKMLEFPKRFIGELQM